VSPTAASSAGVLAPDSPAVPASEQDRLLAAFEQYLRYVQEVVEADAR
jgi:hypothetical protein